MPLLLFQGVFTPRFAAAMGGVMLLGRELYRFGYLDKDGPSSKVREMGAVPLNAAGFFLIGATTFAVLKRQTGGFFSRRKTVRRFTMTHYDLELEKVNKKLDLAERGVGYKPRALLPMHP